MIKVGDWVKYKSTGEIAKARVVDNDNYINGVCIDDCIKLPIKFKDINFNELELWHYACAFKYIRQDTGFMERWCFSVTRDSDKEYRVLIKKQGGKYLELCETLPSIDKANEWANLQYATLIAKARGLV